MSNNERGYSMFKGFRHRISATQILLWCLFTLLLLLGFSEANSISQFSGASMRFNNPITGQAAHRARQYSAANPETFWPTFWHQNTASFSVGVRNANANAISFSGDASLVWPMEFVAGSAPSAIDGFGIVISETLAHRLFGSTNIVGLTIYVNNEPRTIRGVFQGNMYLALLSYHIEDVSQSWTAVELSGGPTHPTRQHAESFAIAAGLGRPNYIIMSGANSLARLMSILPLIIPAIYALVLIVFFVRRYYHIAAAPLFFTGLVIFAILLPVLLNTLPPWVIPTRWSDFSHWSSLIQQVRDALYEFLSIYPTLRDIELRMHLLRQTIIMIFAVCCGIVICTRDNMNKPIYRRPYE